MFNPWRTDKGSSFHISTILLKELNFKISVLYCINLLAPVVQTLDSAIHWINHYPLDNSIGFASVYPLDNDLSGGQRYPSFEQLGPEV